LDKRLTAAPVAAFLLRGVGACDHSAHRAILLARRCGKKAMLLPDPGHPFGRVFRRRLSPFCAAAALCALAAPAAAATYTIFDPPGSVSTVPQGINNHGVVAGWYDTGDNVSHGFVRFADGSFATFDARHSTYTDATGINDRGFVVGNYS